MRRAALVVLYPMVVLLMVVPPLFAAFLGVSCMNSTAAPCRAPTMRDWLVGELAGIWIPPFILALLLCVAIAILHRAGNKKGASEPDAPSSPDDPSQL